jgi:hypothetical protein
MSSPEADLFSLGAKGGRETYEVGESLKRRKMASLASAFSSCEGALRRVAVWPRQGVGQSGVGSGREGTHLDKQIETGGRTKRR